MSMLRTVLPLVVLLAISFTKADRLTPNECNGFQTLVYPKYSGDGVFGTSIQLVAGSTKANCGNGIPSAKLKTEPQFTYIMDPRNSCSGIYGTLILFDIDGGINATNAPGDATKQVGGVLNGDTPAPGDATKQVGGVLNGDTPSADSALSDIMKNANTTNALLFVVNVVRPVLQKGRIIGDVIFNYQEPSRLPTDDVKKHRIVVAYSCLDAKLDPAPIRLNYTNRRLFAPKEFYDSYKIGRINQGQWFTTVVKITT